jgi:hypothetical protein
MLQIKYPKGYLNPEKHNLYIKLKNYKEYMVWDPG